MNWKLWLQGLAAAAIGGASTGATQVISTTGTVNKGTGLAALAGALVTVLAYLTKSPLGRTTPDPTQLQPAAPQIAQGVPDQAAKKQP
ncbi:MAG: hypothetical protein LAP40_23465 [Acidobacteriia bacterium]|nr:hypothetical protein [Terriglobia bacterium]